MKKLITTISLLVVISLMGCQHGDFKMSPVVTGQPAPHDGYNVGPELYLLEGQPALHTGAIIYLKGTEPYVSISRGKMKAPK